MNLKNRKTKVNRKRIKDQGDFERYMIFNRPITGIFEDVEDTGYIESHNKTFVKLNGSYYVKANCEFWSAN
jgi:hypothetical protein